MKKVVEEYLKSSKTSSVKKLSDEQVISFFKDGYCGNNMKYSYLLAESAVRANNLSMRDVISSMRKSMEEGITFKCSYIVSESANGSHDLPKQIGWIVKP